MEYLQEYIGHELNFYYKSIQSTDLYILQRASGKKRNRENNFVQIYINI